MLTSEQLLKGLIQELANLQKLIIISFFFTLNLTISCFLIDQVDVVLRLVGVGLTLLNGVLLFLSALPGYKKLYETRKSKN